MKTRFFIIFIKIRFQYIRGSWIQFVPSFVIKLIKNAVQPTEECPNQTNNGFNLHVEIIAYLIFRERGEMIL